jgi:hypothetical protein
VDVTYSDVRIILKNSFLTLIIFLYFTFLTKLITNILFYLLKNRESVRQKLEKFAKLIYITAERNALRERK